jgi:hypothetical protein
MTSENTEVAQRNPPKDSLGNSPPTLLLLNKNLRRYSLVFNLRSVACPFTTEQDYSSAY